MCGWVGLSGSRDAHSSPHYTTRVTEQGGLALPRKRGCSGSYCLARFVDSMDLARQFDSALFCDPCCRGGLSIRKCHFLKAQGILRPIFLKVKKGKRHIEAHFLKAQGISRPIFLSQGISRPIFLRNNAYRGPFP